MKTDSQKFLLKFYSEVALPLPLREGFFLKRIDVLFDSVIYSLFLTFPTVFFHLPRLREDKPLLFPPSSPRRRGSTPPPRQWRKNNDHCAALSRCDVDPRLRGESAERRRETRENASKNYKSSIPITPGSPSRWDRVSA